MFCHFIRNKAIFKRHKTTVTSLGPSEKASVKRPTPILLLRMTNDAPSNEWSMIWKTRFSHLGYHSVDVAMDIPKEEKEPLRILKTCYDELHQATSKLSFFPPLLISRGESAWKIAQKYVSNKPVSGLVLLPGKEDEMRLPSSQFEPQFPILFVGMNQATGPPEFLDGWIDQVKLDDINNEFQEVMNWMDDIGM
ncbi:hypothetical protein CU097_014133 [Rhizopus azygosporus]|uniref:Uncharacterized protein n=2 Tax=Rhizopus TaxID=4842 RepID=A0A367K361_RHIAZ|nr:hypothetical protein CU097_014133 [Rhizopus azygosporus]